MSVIEHDRSGRRPARNASGPPGSALNVALQSPPRARIRTGVALADPANRRMTENPNGNRQPAKLAAAPTRGIAAGAGDNVQDSPYCSLKYPTKIACSRVRLGRVPIWRTARASAGPAACTTDRCRCARVIAV
jgi:hypothetical protein